METYTIGKGRSAHTYKHWVLSGNKLHLRRPDYKLTLREDKGIASTSQSIVLEFAHKDVAATHSEEVSQGFDWPFSFAAQITLNPLMRESNAQFSTHTKLTNTIRCLNNKVKNELKLIFWYFKQNKGKLCVVFVKYGYLHEHEMEMVFLMKDYM